MTQNLGGGGMVQTQIASVNSGCWSYWSLQCYNGYGAIQKYVTLFDQIWPPAPYVTNCHTWSTLLWKICHSPQYCPLNCMHLTKCSTI